MVQAFTASSSDDCSDRTRVTCLNEDVLQASRNTLRENRRSGDHARLHQSEELDPARGLGAKIGQAIERDDERLVSSPAGPVIAYVVQRAMGRLRVHGLDEMLG